MKCYIPNIKYPCFPVSEKQNFEVGLLCSYEYYSYVPFCDPQRLSQFLPKGHHMNKLGRGPLGDVTYQISKLQAFHFQRRRILKFSFFVPTVQLVTPRAGPVLTLGASCEQTWYSSTRRCYIQNIKTQGLPVSKKKNFKVCHLCSYVPTCDPRMGPVLTQGASYEQTWERSTRRCYIPNIKAVGLSVSEKKNFEDQLLCS